MAYGSYRYEEDDFRNGWWKNNGHHTNANRRFVAHNNNRLNRRDYADRCNGNRDWFAVTDSRVYRPMHGDEGFFRIAGRRSGVDRNWRNGRPQEFFFFVEQQRQTRCVEGRKRNWCSADVCRCGGYCGGREQRTGIGGWRNDPNGIPGNFRPYSHCDYNIRRKFHMNEAFYYPDIEYIKILIVQKKPNLTEEKIVDFCAKENVAVKTPETPLVHEQQHVAEEKVVDSSAKENIMVVETAETPDAHEEDVGFQESSDNVANSEADDESCCDWTNVPQHDTDDEWEQV